MKDHQLHEITQSNIKGIARQQSRKKDFNCEFDIFGDTYSSYPKLN